MLKQLKSAFHRAGIDITHIPLTLDAAYVSQELRNRLHQVGFRKIIIAGKGNRSYWIPGSEASMVPRNLHLFLRALKNKGLKEEIVTKIGLYDLVKFHDPGIQ